MRSISVYADKKKKKPDGKSSAQAVRDVIAAEYSKLGSWSTAEVTVGLCFGVLVALWFLRNPRMFPGWLEFFPYEVS